MIAEVLLRIEHSLLDMNKNIFIRDTIGVDCLMIEGMLETYKDSVKGSDRCRSTRALLR